MANSSSNNSLVPGIGRIPIPAYRGKEKYIFVSYAHIDHELVFKEIKRFTEAGYHVWYDEGINPGNEWTQEIAEALINCSLFVMMVTPNSICRRNVQNELSFALKKEKPILAIHLQETVLPEGMELQLGAVQTIYEFNMTEEEYNYKSITVFDRYGLREKNISDEGQSSDDTTSRKKPAQPQKGHYYIEEDLTEGSYSVDRPLTKMKYHVDVEKEPCAKKSSMPMSKNKRKGCFVAGALGVAVVTAGTVSVIALSGNHEAIKIDPGTVGIVLGAGALIIGIPTALRALLSHDKPEEAYLVAATSEKDDLLDEMTEVQFSAVAPEILKRSEYSVIDIMMYEKEFRHMVDEVISQAKEPVKETKSGVLKVARDTDVRVELHSPDLNIDDHTQTQRWTGSLLRFQYAVMLPEDCDKNQILFNADVFFNDVIATKLKFTVYCDASGKQKMHLIRDDIMSAFVSYSSEDRSRVAAIVQGMSKARPDLDIFFDIENLRSGEDWEKVLTKEIDKRDMLYLCWSDNASKSEWVDYEWRYVYDRKGPEYIEPIPLESPEKCPPPEELSKKHFNDKLLYVINA